MDFFDLIVTKLDKKQESIKQVNHCDWSQIRYFPDLSSPLTLDLVMFFLYIT